MKKSVSYFVFCIILFLSSLSNANPKLGLYIEDGKFFKDGKIVNAHGVNYFNLFLRINHCELRGIKDDLSWRKGLKTLAKEKVPFARFSISPFYATEWKVYLDDKEKYFKNLDKIVKEAEKNNIGLIPSFFWNYHSIPDVVHEHMNAIGDETSKTREFMRNYIVEVVSRYKNSSAIWGWEYGNEHALSADLPNDAGIPRTIIDLGMPPTRDSKLDKPRREDLHKAYQEFAFVIKELDTRPVFTGDSIPRASAYHNVSEGSWKPDSQEEFKEIFLRDNPDPIDTLTIHAYEDAMNIFVFAKDDYNKMMSICMEISSEIKKPLFVGEWGIAGNISKDKSLMQKVDLMTNSIKQNNVQLSAVWVFDYDPQKDFTIQSNNFRKDFFNKLRLLNNNK